MPEWDIAVRPGQSVIGGGSTPEQALPTWVLAIAEPGVEKLEQKLRLGTPAVVARIEDDRLTLDLRTYSRKRKRRSAKRWFRRVRGSCRRSC